MCIHAIITYNKFYSLYKFLLLFKIRVREVITKTMKYGGFERHFTTMEAWSVLIKNFIKRINKETHQLLDKLKSPASKISRNLIR